MCSWASLVFVSQINRMLQLGELLQLLVIIFIMFYILASLIITFLFPTSMCLLGEPQFPRMVLVGELLAPRISDFERAPWLSLLLP